MLTRAAGWTAAALTVLIFSVGHALAYPVAKPEGFQRPATGISDLVAFRRGQGGGGSFSRYHARSYRYSERPARSFLTRRQASSRAVHVESIRARSRWWRRPSVNRVASASRQPEYPPRIPSHRGEDVNRPRPPRDPGNSDIWWPIRKPPRLPPIAFASPPPAAVLVVPPVAAAIAGFGGSRPPIAPRFSRGQGQQPSTAVAALLNNKRHRAKELLIEVATESSDQLKQALSAQYGVEVRELGSIDLINATIWHLTLVRGQALATVLGQLLQDNRVISAQPNYVYTPVQGTGQGSPAAYSETTARPVEVLPTGGGVKVAIIDTCVDRNHAEIQGAVQSYFDATPSGSRSCVAENHGTAVASLIGGHDQIRGSAPGAELMEARAFTETEEEKEVAATSREIALALDWSARQGARVANLSFAGPSDPLVERAVAAAYMKGIVLVGAAGNAGPSSVPLYPAAYPEVIAVTAIDAKRALYSAANRGSHIAVSARGVDVIVAHVNNGYGTESGTSFAAATVSGIAALLVKMRPRATPDEIRAALQGTATSPSGKGKDELFGYGLVNAKAATSFLEASVSQ